MKSFRLTKLQILSCAFLLLAFTACKENQQETQDTENEVTAVYTETSADEDCTCGSDWFPHDQTPNPPEGTGSPFDSPTTTNCIFHQWSWQKFLYLTKPSNSNILYLEDMIQVDSNMLPVQQDAGAQVVLTDIHQAGPDGVLMSNPAYNAAYGSAETVYYSIHINDTMQAAANTFKEGLADGSITPDNDLTFPVGSLELKVAYISINSIPSENLDDYAIVKAMVGDATEVQEMAIIGMHVVGVVINHPEFIWATFEHKSMAPDFDWTSMTASSDQGDLFFAKGSTSSLDGISWGSGAPKAADQAYMLFKYGVPKVKGGGYMNTSQSEPLNYNNIDALNSCATAGLSGEVWANYFLNGALWIDTDGTTLAQQVALIKKLGGNLGNALPADTITGTKKDYARGSVNAANLTMETFVQTFNSDPSSIEASDLFNCLHCHNAPGSGGSSPLYISHIFDGFIQQHQGLEPQEINQKKLKAFLDVLESRKD